MLPSSYLCNLIFIITQSEKYGFALLQVKQLRSGGCGRLCSPHVPGAGPDSLSHTGGVFSTV